MRIALTGATGFLGNHCLQRFQARGWSVRAWYRGPNPPNASGSIEWIRGDLDDPDAAERLVQGCDHVVHTALSRHSDSFMAEPDDSVAYYQSNVVGTLRLMEAAAKEFGPRHDPGRFLFLSSGAVHEKVAGDLPLDERHPLWPASMYGACKASVETLVHSFGLSGRLAAATIRPVSIVGVEEPSSKSKWFDLVQAVAKGETVDVSGGGKVVFVDDVVSAIELLLTTRQPIAGKTFNACSDFVTHHQVATIAKQLSGSDAKLLGNPKQSKNPMQTGKIEGLGLQFSGEQKLREIVGELLGG